MHEANGNSITKKRESYTKPTLQKMDHLAAMAGCTCGCIAGVGGGSGGGGT